MSVCVYVCLCVCCVFLFYLLAFSFRIVIVIETPSVLFPSPSFPSMENLLILFSDISLCFYFIYLAVNKKLVNSNRFYFTAAAFAWESVYNAATLFYLMPHDALALIFLSMNRTMRVKRERERFRLLLTTITIAQD